MKKEIQTKDKETTSKTVPQVITKTTEPLAVASSSQISRGGGIFSRIADRLVGEKKELGKYWKKVDEILAFDETMGKLTDKQLADKTLEFRKELKGLEGDALQKKLQDILPEAFAVVREAADRTIGQKHYPVQLIGGMVLNDGRVAEMRTGEGKTLVSTLATYLNALPEKNQVHLVTVNDYLARRDASWMGQIYNFLGLSIGIIQNQSSFYFQYGAQADDQSELKREQGRVDTLEDGEQQDSRAVLDVEHLVSCDRKRAYINSETKEIVDIVYGVNSEFGFDYLRDNMADTIEDVVQQAGHRVAIIDEVDSILIDEARTPLIISSQSQDSGSRYKQFASLVSKLTPDIDFEVDEKRKAVTLTDLGMDKVQSLLGIENLYLDPQNVVLVHHLDQALKASNVFKREKEYVVRDGEIIIVDENTGRMMYGRRYNQGLHQAIEAKEGLAVNPESRTVGTITFQNFFRLYDKLAGMTGTAATESEELFKIYKLLVVTIPTNRAVIRKDFIDKVFKNEAGKFKAIARDIKEINATGQPILIGTTSIDKNLALSQALKDIGVKHEVLNAKNHEQEARIVSQAGRKGAVTLATNIAGRGVDIKLGGEVPADKKEFKKWLELHEEVKELGGLFVIGTERHESRRIDNQLRGRAGRQGDPGSSQFYISLEDYILRVFGGERITYYNILPVAEDEAIQNRVLSNLIEEAQKKIEGFHYDSRKNVTEYDDVINRQRIVIYERRNKVLKNEGYEWEPSLKDVVERTSYEITRAGLVDSPRSKNFNENVDLMSEQLNAIVKLEDFSEKSLKESFKESKYNADKITESISKKILNVLEERWQNHTEGEKNAMMRYLNLRAIDTLWTEHLVSIDHLSDSVRMRGYSQKDPLVEFKQDGMMIFVSLINEIDKEVAFTLFRVTPDMVPQSMMKQEK
jgi:preprotein translocase subunit SecA